MATIEHNLHTYDGEFPFDVNETVENVLNAALRAAYTDLNAAGLGPCFGDVAPWESESLNAIGDLLVRFAATNAPGLQEPAEVEEPTLMEDGVLAVSFDPRDGWQTVTVTGGYMNHPDGPSYKVRLEDGSEVFRLAEHLHEKEPTASERIRAARESAPVEVLVHVNVTVDGDRVTASVPLAERIG